MCLAIILKAAGIIGTGVFLCYLAKLIIDAVNENTLAPPVRSFADASPHFFSDQDHRLHRRNPGAIREDTYVPRMVSPPDSPAPFFH